MNDHVRDTAFGHLVRLLSSNKLSKFPDEQNPSLCKQSVPSSAVIASNVQQSDSVEDGNQLISEPDIGAERGLSPASCIFNESGSKAQNKDEDGAHIEKTGDIILVDWYGPDDQENPQNWSSNRKLLVASQICLQNFAVYAGSAIYTPGELDMMKEFGVSEIVATLGLSLFVLGYGLGPMLFSPMSEIPVIGRSRIYFWTILAFVLLQLPVGYATNMPVLLVFRFITGFLGGPVLSTGGATIADMYSPAQVPYGICIWGSFGVLGPVLGPLMAGFAVQAKGWRWAIWELTWMCSIMLILLFFLMPETNPANILYRRAKRLRKATGNSRLRSQSEIDASEATTRDQLIVLGRAFTLTFSEPIVFILDLYCALLYGVLYVWFESFPMVFGDIYGFNIGQQGLVFLGILAGAFIGVPGYMLWIRWYMVPRFNQSDVKPEMILPPTFIGAFTLPICLFWYGWTSRSDVHWIVPIVGTGFFTISVTTMFSPIISYLGMIYPQFAASVYAGNSLFRATFGAIFPLFARALFRKLDIGPGNSLLGGLSIIFIPIPFALFYYGGRIRHWSKNAQHDD